MVKVDFSKDMNAPRNLVHGTYLENLPGILRAGGLFPLLMLNDEDYPLVGFNRKPEFTNTNGISVIELHTQPHGYRYSLEDGELWGNYKFHFSLVLDYPYRAFSRSDEDLRAEGFTPKNYPGPYHQYCSELYLVNQGVSLGNLRGILVPTDELIDYAFYRSRNNKVNRAIFSDEEGNPFSSRKIASRVVNTFKSFEMNNPPIFDLFGNRIDVD